MNETQVSLAGIIFLISALCACGSGTDVSDALTASNGQTASDQQGVGHGKSGQHGKGKGKGQAEADDEETCDAGKLANPSTVVLCIGGESPQQVCTDIATALSKYGLDPSKPNTVAPNGDHIGSC